MRRSLQEQNTKEYRDQKHKEAPHQHKKTPSQQGGSNKTKQDRRQQGGQHKKTPSQQGGEQQNQTGQKAARRAEPRREGALGEKSGGQQKGERGRQGRQQRHERENRTGQEGGRAQR